TEWARRVAGPSGRQTEPASVPQTRNGASRRRFLSCRGWSTANAPRRFDAASPPPAWPRPCSSPSPPTRRIHMSGCLKHRNNHALKRSKKDVNARDKRDKRGHDEGDGRFNHFRNRSKSRFRSDAPTNPDVSAYFCTLATGRNSGSALPARNRVPVTEI